MVAQYSPPILIALGNEINTAMKKKRPAKSHPRAPIMWRAIVTESGGVYASLSSGLGEGAVAVEVGVGVRLSMSQSPGNSLNMFSTSRESGFGEGAVAVEVGVGVRLSISQSPGNSLNNREFEVYMKLDVGAVDTSLTATSGIGVGGVYAASGLASWSWSIGRRSPRSTPHLRQNRSFW